MKTLHCFTGISVIVMLSMQPAVAQCLLEQIQSTDPPPGGGFGRSVVINGSQAVIGEMLGVANQGPGLAHVYNRVNGQWILEGTVEASDNQGQAGGIGPGDGFGHAMAIDGDTLLVGAPFHSVLPPQMLTDAGAVYVYKRIGSTWLEEAKLLSNPPVLRGLFGYSIAMDGDLALIGAGFSGGNGEGAAYIFRNAEAGWVQEQHIGPGIVPDSSSSFGVAVALEENTALIADWMSNGNEGRVFAFENDGASWNHVQTLSATSADSVGSFGYGLSLEGDRLMVGAFTATGGGAVYFFQRDLNGWIQQAELKPSGTLNGAFGKSVRLQGDVALVGSPGKDFLKDFGKEFIQDAGAAYLFQESGGAWTQTLMLSATDHQESAFYGEYVALQDGYGLVASPSHPLPGTFGLVDSFYFPTATLEADVIGLPLGTGGSQTLTLRSPATPGALYFLLGSTANACPGTFLDDEWLPLSFDAYMLFTLLNPNSPLLSPSLGFLALDGTANITFAIPPGLQGLAGVTLHHAALIADVSTGSIVAVSDAQAVQLGH